jgi:hypothetical protein
MDDRSSEDAQSTARRPPSPQRPTRGAKPAGLYTPVNPLRPTMTSRSNILTKDKGKRERVDSFPSGDEGGDEGDDEVGPGGSSGMSGNGNGEGGAEAEGTRRKKVKTKEEPRELTPPSECEMRWMKKDPDLKITEAGPKMKAGDAPRYYAKISREVEHFDSKKQPYDKLVVESYRMPNHPPILLPGVDLSLLRTSDCVHVLPDREIVRFAMEPMVLPLLKQWAYLWLNPDMDSKQFHKDMRRTFPMDGEHSKPWSVGVRLVADHAAHKVGFTFDLAPLLYRMSSFAQRLVNSNGAFFDRFGAYSLATDERHKFAARVLLVVWEDLETDRNGFFGILLKGELARPNRPEVRKVYEGWYVVDERLFR